MSRYILGIDIGSVSVSTAMTDADRKIIKTSYAFHKGEIRDTLEKELEKYTLGEDFIVAATSSCPDFVERDFDYDNQVAVIQAAKTLYDSFDSILFVGGEKFGFLVFDEAGNYKSFKTNTSCAAGTGSFLDQQAGRLNLGGIESLSDTAYSNKGKFPLIASRCAVFAKTDLIHAQQEGYSFKEISDGLCYGLAKNITDTLFTGARPHGKILFCGGVSKNKAVKKHIEKISGIKFITDEYSNVYGAIGAAFLASEEKDSMEKLSGRTEIKFIKDIKKGKDLYYKPLKLNISKYPDFSGIEDYFYQSASDKNTGVEVNIYEETSIFEKKELWLGIDIGSTSTKAVLTGFKNEPVAGFYTRTAGNPLKAVSLIFESIDNIKITKNIDFKISGCATTGSGRKFIGKITGADMVIDEITAHARAASQIDPDVDTIIEIGGQDAKFTVLKNSVVTFSTMNNVCAAGTGSFIEEQARKLGVEVKDYALRTDGIMAPMSSDRCTVFMERDINHYLAEGYGVDEVLASALHSVCENYLVKVATENLIGNHIYFQGATAKNRSLVAAFEQRLEKPVHVSKFCHLNGALGASLILKDEFAGKTSFRGFDLYKKTIPVFSEVCGLCNNNCKITIADIDGEKVAYGFLCGRDYDTKKYVGKKDNAFDLLKERKKIIRKNRSSHNMISQDSPVIGIPYSLHLVDDHEMWKEFFSSLGIKTVSSAGYKDAVKTGKKLSETEFCAPASAMFGHCNYLFDKCDYIFLPFYLEDKVDKGRHQYCYYTQYMPPLISKAGRDRVLSPLVNYLYTNFYSKIELYKMFRSIGMKKSFFEISFSYENALEFKQKCLHSFRKFYENQISESDNINIVFLGRPYTIMSETMNNKIPDIFSGLGVKSFYQDMLPLNNTVKPDSPAIEVHWKYASKILEAAEKIAQTDNLYPVYVTSFKCSPDSFALRFFKDIMEKNKKPYLVLELDEHDSSVGYETRIESAVRAFKNDSKTLKPVTKPDYSSLIFKSEKELSGKNLIFPNWDNITCRFLCAVLKREGINSFLIEETENTILKSMKFNTGQCLPANSIAQGFVETIEKNKLDPSESILWMSKANFCNIKLYPNFIWSLLQSYGNGMGNAGIFHGELTFNDISIRAAKNAYFSHLFGGMIRKMGCTTRPYEVNKGETDRVINESIKIIEQSFLGQYSKEKAVLAVVDKFRKIKTFKKGTKPRVAIFGDIYVRDNSTMNQGLVRFIEDNGGEVITTPYTELGKIIAPMYFKKWFNEGLYYNLFSVKILSANMKIIEKKYLKMFNEVINEPVHEYNDDPEEILQKFGIRKENAGESMENILKIHYLSKHYPDLALFVQANPVFCCPSIVTESMKTKIEKVTSKPVVTITYDGTGGYKNRSIIPYLKFSRPVSVRNSKFRYKVS